MAFAAKLIAWQRRFGRRGLPWQGTREPYRIWLSEVMLQQTQVSVVIPYYERFLQRFPDVATLARATQDEVLQLWSGLGYYARGRNLHRAARRIARHGFPASAAAIAELPGVGRSTAAAIAVFAYGERAAILDGNVKRVLSRCFGLSDPKSLWRIADRLVPKRGVERYTQALMDLGATVCTRRAPRCESCPVSMACVAKNEDRTDDLPARRPKKALPQRKTTWLVVVDRGKVLLERRPAAGIWGGLWCFPEALRAPAGGKKLAPLEHGFTHFRLRIQPILCKGAPRGGPGRRWIGLAEARDAAIPTPVRRLLNNLCP